MRPTESKRHADKSNDSFRYILSPIMVGPYKLRNRLITTGHAAFRIWSPEDPGDQYIEYQRRRAAGGAAMLICHTVMIEPYGEWPAPLAPKMKRLTEAIHDEGAVAVLQLTSYGAQGNASYNQYGRPLWSMNGAPAPEGEASHLMTTEEVHAMVDGFRRAAEIAISSGFDGVEIHGAHGYLIEQSYSRWGNGRSDEWGEPLAFATAVVNSVRNQVGPDRIVGYRASLDERRPDEPDGMTPEELAATAAAVVNLGQISYLNVSSGSRFPRYAQYAVANYRHPQGGQLHLSAGIRQLTGARVPVVGVGRIVDPRMAEEAVRTGKCDLVAMTRGHISDPEIVKKLSSGMAGRIRPCVGANECNDRRLAGAVVACFHNPDAGNESAAIRPDGASRRLLIVGGGPAGLKAAETAVKRGHHVEVHESASELGGELRYTRLTAARALHESISWLEKELRHEGAAIYLNSTVDEALIGDMRPDAVIVATGTMPGRRLRGFDLAAGKVLSSTQALDAAPDGRVIVLDRTGQVEAALVAETLSGRADVLFVSPFEILAPYAGLTHRLDLLDVFRQRRIAMLLDHEVAGYTGSQVEIHRRFSSDAVYEKADIVVAVTPGEPNMALPTWLRSSGIPYKVVGDALAARGATTAFREGAEAIASLPDWACGANQTAID